MKPSLTVTAAALAITVSHVGAAPAATQVASFDGSGTHIVISNAPELIPALGFTLECWTRGSDAAGRLVNVGDGVRGATNRAYDLSVTTGEFIGWIFFQGSDGVQLTAPMTDSGWTHLAMTFDSANGIASLSVDGELVVSKTQTQDGTSLTGLSIRPSSFPLVFGRNNSFSAWNLDGELARVRIWSHALSADEARCLSDVEISSASMPSYPGLVDVWNLSGDSLSVSGNHDGTIVGSLSFIDDVIPSLFVRPYCIGAPNSVGAGAMIDHTGTTSIAQNDLLLTVEGCPPMVVALVLFGRTRGQSPRGDGYQCLVGPDVDGLAAVVTDVGGTATAAVDYSALPAGGALAGKTLHFQFAYRDVAGPGGSGFNFSNSLSIEFCP